MKRTYRFGPVAQREMRQAACHYDSLHTGLGKAFTKAVKHQAAEIARQPELWGKVGETARESPIPGFDFYSIIYEIHDDHIYVLSVFHASREPKDW